MSLARTDFSNITTFKFPPIRLLFPWADFVFTNEERNLPVVVNPTAPYYDDSISSRVKWVLPAYNISTGAGKGFHFDVFQETRPDGTPLKNAKGESIFGGKLSFVLEKALPASVTIPQGCTARLVDTTIQNAALHLKYFDPATNSEAEKVYPNLQINYLNNGLVELAIHLSDAGVKEVYPFMSDNAMIKSIALSGNFLASTTPPPPAPTIIPIENWVINSHTWPLPSDPILPFPLPTTRPVGVPGLPGTRGGLRGTPFAGERRIWPIETIDPTDPPPIPGVASSKETEIIPWVQEVRLDHLSCLECQDSYRMVDKNTGAFISAFGCATPWQSGAGVVSRYQYHARLSAALAPYGIASVYASTLVSYQYFLVPENYCLLRIIKKNEGSSAANIPNKLKPAAKLLGRFGQGIENKVYFDFTLSPDISHYQYSKILRILQKEKLPSGQDVSIIWPEKISAKTTNVDVPNLGKVHLAMGANKTAFNPIFDGATGYLILHSDDLDIRYLPLTLETLKNGSGYSIPFEVEIESGVSVGTTAQLSFNMISGEGLRISAVDQVHKTVELTNLTDTVLQLDKLLVTGAGTVFEKSLAGISMAPLSGHSLPLSDVPADIDLTSSDVAISCIPVIDPDSILDTSLYDDIQVEQPIPIGIADPEWFNKSAIRELGITMEMEHLAGQTFQCSIKNGAVESYVAVFQLRLQHLLQNRILQLSIAKKYQNGNTVAVAFQQNLSEKTIVMLGPDELGEAV